jgi:hypothetical protein
MSLSPVAPIYPGLFSYTASVFPHSATDRRPLRNRVAGVLGDIGQFIVERCDQQELLLYFRILHLTRDSANGLRFLPIIVSLVYW